MIYLITILIPPLYFALRKKWGSFVVNEFFYLLSFPLLILWGFGVVIWMFCVAHAGWFLRKELIEEAAETLASKMAGKMRETIDSSTLHVQVSQAAAFAGAGNAGPGKDAHNSSSSGVFTSNAGTFSYQCSACGSFQKSHVMSCSDCGTANPHRPSNASTYSSRSTESHSKGVVTDLVQSPLFCSECGERMDRTYKFCAQCGSSLS